MPDDAAGNRDVLVSVVTPLYNHADFLPDYFDGLLSQTHPRIELIIVDDCSTDDSRSVLEGFRGHCEARFERLDFSANTENLGLMRTLERALSKVAGSYTCILESDDYFYPGKIAANVERLSTSQRVALVHSDVDFHHESSGHLERAHWKSGGRQIPQGVIYEDLLSENHILTCSTTIRTDALLETIDLDRYARAGYKTADYPLFLDLSKRYEIAYIDEALACYRVVDESISHPADREKQLEWKLAYYQIKMDQLEATDVSAVVDQRIKRQYHHARLQLSWIRGDARELESASRDLEQLESAPELHWLGNRARRLLIRSRLGWRFGRLLEEGLRKSTTQEVRT